MDERIQEGGVCIARQGVVGKVEGPAESSSDTLFYNPAQVFNRDLSLVVAKCYGRRVLDAAFAKYNEARVKKRVPRVLKGLTFCEPLAASCLRSLRYAIELPPSLYAGGVAGDISGFAVQQGIANRTLNNVPERTLKILEADANELMTAGKYVAGTSQWDVVDVDPYGTVSPFVDSAIRAVADNGLLCVTSTDMPVLGGNAPGIAFYKYGGNTIKAPYLHEMSLRLILNLLISTAARHKRYVKPLLACSVDFYVRVWVTVHDTPVDCASISCRTASVFQCCQCDWFATIPFGHALAEKGKNAERNKRRKVSKQNGATPSTAVETVAAAVGEPEAAADQPETELKHKKEEIKSARTVTYSGDRASKVAVGRVPEEIEGSKCPMCDGALCVGGPFYAGPLHDYDFVRELKAEVELSTSDTTLREADNDSAAAEIRNGVLEAADSTAEIVSEKLAWVKTAEARYLRDKAEHRLDKLSPTVGPKIKALLTVILEEEHVKEVPLHYDVASLCSRAGVSAIRQSHIKQVLRLMGYKIGIFHREPLSLKTDAPSYVMFDIIRAWARKMIEEGTSKSPKAQQFADKPFHRLTPQPIPLDEASKKDPRPTGPKEARFVPNPEAHWGPGRRAGK